MPATQRVQVSFNVYPWEWEEIKKTADAQNKSASQFVGELVRWGVRGMAIEGMRQGVELHLDDLYHYMVETVTEYHWGAVAPSLTVAQEVGLWLDNELDVTDARIKIDDADPDALTAAVRRVIEDMKAKGEL